MKKKLILLAMILVMISISAVSAADNQTIMENTDDGESEETDAEIIVDDEYKTYYDAEEDIYFDLNTKVYIEEAYFDIVNDKNDDVIGHASYMDYEASMYFYAPVGTYHATMRLAEDSIGYKINPVSFTVKITKAPVKLTAKKWISTTKQYTTLKAIVKDKSGFDVDEGTVKFKINGKTYSAKVKDGVAVKKIKLKKAKTYTYTATFTSKNYKTKTTTSKVYVKKVKKYYTFKATDYHKHKATGKLVYNLPYKYYVKLLNAKNNGKACHFTLKSNVKVYGNKWYNTRCGFDVSKKGKMTFTYEVVYNYYPVFASKTYDLFKTI